LEENVQINVLVIAGVGNIPKKNVWEEWLDPMQHCSLNVQRLLFVISWLAHWHTYTQSGRLTDRQIDSFWPVVLLAAQVAWQIKRVNMLVR